MTRNRSVQPAEGWASNQGVRLHYLETHRDSAPDLTPIVYIPGMMGSAEAFLREMDALAPRRCIGVSLRGRGRSEAPPDGYTFQHHISDIQAIIKTTGLRSFCLMAWSIGVPYSIGYASRDPELVSGLILLDYPARYPAFSLEWVDRTMARLSGTVSTHVITGLQHDSSEVLLWDRLQDIRCPVLVIGGGQADSLLKPEHVEKYRHYLPRAEIAVFKDSGHDVSQPDYNRFIATVKLFLSRCDEKANPSQRELV